MYLGSTISSFFFSTKHKQNINIASTHGDQNVIPGKSSKNTNTTIVIQLKQLL